MRKRQGNLVDMRLPDLIPGGILALALMLGGVRPALSEAALSGEASGLLTASSANVAGSAGSPAPLMGGVLAAASAGAAPAPAAAPQSATSRSALVVWASSSAVAPLAPLQWSVEGIILDPSVRPPSRDDVALLIRIAPPLPAPQPSPAAPVVATAPAPAGIAANATAGAPLRPRLRDDRLPAMSWDHRPDGGLWTRTTLAAVHQAGLTSVMPSDIATWCPAYPRAGEDDRAAFWSGVLSALARYESTHNPRAVGGGGLYHGLLQILPSTARQYGCEARTGEALRNGPANLACAVRIAAENVIRDAAVAREDDRNAGLARDWGPMTVASRRAEMAAWTRSQDYCRLTTAVLDAPLPPARPWTLLASRLAKDPALISLALLSDDIRDLRAIPPPRS